METGDEGVSNFHLNRTVGVISQFTKFEILSLDCNLIEGFQILEKLETLYGI